MTRFVAKVLSLHGVRSGRQLYRRPTSAVARAEKLGTVESTCLDGDVTNGLKFLRKGQFNRHIIYEAELVPSRVL